MKYILLVLLLFMPATAFATWGTEDSLALNWSRYDTQWQLEDESAPQLTNIDRLSLTETEPLNNWLYAGVSVGYVEVRQPGTIASAGSSPHGFSWGVMLGSRIWENDYFAINAQINYTYHWLENNIDLRELEFKWATMTGRLGVAFNVWHLRFSLGTYQSAVDGTLGLSPTITQVARMTTFEMAEKDTGIYGGMGLVVGENGGRVSLHYQNGAREGYMLTFSRGF